MRQKTLHQRPNKKSSNLQPNKKWDLMFILSLNGIKLMLPKTTSLFYMENSRMYICLKFKIQDADELKYFSISHPTNSETSKWGVLPGPKVDIFLNIHAWNKGKIPPCFSIYDFLSSVVDQPENLQHKIEYKCYFFLRY